MTLYKAAYVVHYVAEVLRQPVASPLAPPPFEGFYHSAILTPTLPAGAMALPTFNRHLCRINHKLEGDAHYKELHVTASGMSHTS